MLFEDDDHDEIESPDSSPPPSYDDAIGLPRVMDIHKGKGAPSKRKYKPDTWAIEKRKAFFYLTPTHRMRERMDACISKLYMLLDPQRAQDDCWLHPSPQTYEDGRLRGTIRIDLHFNGHKYNVNVGIVAMVLNHRLTAEQKDGIIKHSWHAIHLCGNLTCMNWKHFCVESSHSSAGRNGCLGPDVYCPHDPPCMKHLKRSLILTQVVRTKIYNCVISTTFDCRSPRQIIAIDDVSDCARSVYCDVCKARHHLAPFCSYLNSQKRINALLSAFATCEDFGNEQRTALNYLTQIKADLELRDGFTGN